MKHAAFLAALFFVLFAGGGESGCSTPAATTSGVKRAIAEVQVGPDDMTVEQRNVRDRLRLDNAPGSIKHLYVISAYSGQTLIYSTVRGKVTSSGKRLTPMTVAVAENRDYGFDVSFPGGEHVTAEVMQDDGTYGSSVEYLYWWDAQGRYHQHYVEGGQIVHVSDQPLNVRGVVINMELVTPAPPSEAGTP